MGLRIEISWLIFGDALTFRIANLFIDVKNKTIIFPSSEFGIDGGRGNADFVSKCYQIITASLR